MPVAELNARARTLDLLLLAALCLPLYFLGLDDHGVTNWQEAQRLLVAREMQRDGAWLVPTVNGLPYLAKPPMIYWAQLALARLTGGEVELWHLRFVVACSGLASVMLTYVFARRLFENPPLTGAFNTPATIGDDLPTARARRAAVIAAASLATGFLVVRSARTGELDALIVPFVLGALLCFWSAWRHAVDTGRTHWPGVLGAALLTVAATLTKDPAVAIVGLAAFGGVAFSAAYADDPWPHMGKVTPIPNATRAVRTCARLLGAAAFGALAAGNLDEWGDLPGVLVLALAGAMLADALAQLSVPLRARALFLLLSRTHPLLVLGLPIALRIAWAMAVDASLGYPASRTLASQEAEDNIRPFLPEAPLNNLEALIYAVGVASFVAPLALWFRLRERRPTTPRDHLILAWLLLNLLLFSVVGKGVNRYLLPVWPALALFSAPLLAAWLAPGPRARERRVAAVIIVLALSVPQALYYGVLRDRLDPHHSPRDFMAELLNPEHRVDRSRLVSLGFTTPALDYYAAHRVQPVEDDAVNITMAGGLWTLDDLRAEVSVRGPMVALVRLEPEPGAGDERDGPAILRDAGFLVEPIAVGAEFRVDRFRTPVGAVRIDLSGDLTNDRSVSPAP